MIIVPKDQATLTFLRETDKLTYGWKVSLLALIQEDRKVKMVLLVFLVICGPDVITSHPKILGDSRLTKGKNQTSQVLVTVKGALVRSLDLGNWFSYTLKTYVPDPLQCFTCQKYRHHQATCLTRPKFGVCSKTHNTGVCLKAHKKGHMGHHYKVS